MKRLARLAAFVRRMAPPPWPLGAFVGADVIGRGWLSDPVVGWARLTADEVASGNYPDLLRLAWFRIGPLDLNFEIAA